MILYIKNMFLIGRRKRGRSARPAGKPPGKPLRPLFRRPPAAFFPPNRPRNKNLRKRTFEKNVFFLIKQKHKKTPFYNFETPTPISKK